MSMAASLHFIQSPLSFAAFLIPWLFFSAFWGLGHVCFLLTSCVLVLSTVSFAVPSRRTVLLLKKPRGSEEIITSDRLENLPRMEKDASETPSESDDLAKKNPENILYWNRENFLQSSGDAETFDEVHQELNDDHFVGSIDSLSESRSLRHSSTDDCSEEEWPFQNKVDQSSACSCSDGSISDEESLLEISLHSGHYPSPKEEDSDSEIIFQKKFSDFSTEPLLGQHGLMQMNKEENLIEIDISGGSIKYSRFEVEA